jgi:hypothetical protein
MELEIIEKGKYSYSIVFKNATPKNEILLKALLQSKLLGAGTNVNAECNKINFNATEVITLNNLLSKYQKERNLAKLDYDETENLVLSLHKQVKNLERHNYTFSNFHLENIVVITKNKKKIFISVSTEDMFEIKNKSITFISPFDLKDRFLDPVVKKINVLPAKAHYKSCYYSLGSLAMYCIFSDFEEDDRERKLRQIKFTGLYWKILKCLDEDFDKRGLIQTL